MSEINAVQTPKLIKANKFEEAGAAHNRYHITIGVDFTKEDIFLPENWVQVLASGYKLLVGDIIEIRREDFNFYLEAMVMSADKHSLVLKQLSFTQLEEEGEKEDAGLKIIWKGPSIKFAVVRANGKELGKGFATKAEAQNFLEDNR